MSWTFQYKHGDRPLDGFTIQRAAGRGGFGEVYYAVSDSGREVALKAVTGYEQIEVRGISQCMNLKSPHLVTIFDVKYNDQGKPFVIMEFVGGPNLRQLLDDSPAGIGTQKAAFFLREIGKGLTFLHDCGIVHRDLKPANIFFENGYVKIGDYGLSKAISPTQHSGQTVTVGTVHYMAPEVGAGKYDRSIDIYALGAVLYEMLTGTVPFIGASPSEILIKHLQADPDCSGIPEPFCSVIKKAMAKDPSQRYANVQEMVEAVFGAAHVQMSVSHFSPDELSVVAGRVAQKVGIGGGFGGGSSSVTGGQTVNAGAPNRFGDDAVDGGWNRVMKEPFDRLRDRMGQIGSGGATPAQSKSDVGINDPLPRGSRWLLGLLTAVVVSVAMGALMDSSQHEGLTLIAIPMLVLTSVCGGSLGLLAAWRGIAIPKLSQESSGVRKLVVAIVTCGLMLLFSGLFWIIIITHGRYNVGTLAGVLIPLSLFNTWQWVRANREERVSLGAAIGIACVGMVFCWMFDGQAMLAFGVLAGISLATQVMSPWDSTLAKRRTEALRAKYRGVKEDPREGVEFSKAGPPPIGRAAAGRTGTAYSGDPRIPNPPAIDSWRNRAQFPVWQHAPLIWLLAAGVLFSIGLTFIIVASASRFPNQQQTLVAGLGVCGLVNALFCFARSLTRRYSTIWSYLVRPVLLMLCIDSIVFFADMLANENTPDPFSVFMIILSSLVLIALPFLRRSTPSAAVIAPIIPPVPISPPLPPTDSSAAASAPPPSAPAIDPAANGDSNDPPALNWWGYPRNQQDYGRWRRWDRTRRLRNGRVVFASFVSGWTMLFAATAIAAIIALGADLPLAVSLGLPDASTAHDIRTHFIGDYGNWPILAKQILSAVALLAVLLAAIFALIARRGTSFLHLLRAIVGIGGLVLAAILGTKEFGGDVVWPQVAQFVHANPPKNGEALELIINRAGSFATIAAAVLFVLSIVILFVPPRNPNKETPIGVN